MAKLWLSDEELMGIGERRTAEELQKGLPDDWDIYCNKIIPLELGFTRELDFIVVAPGYLMLLEDKNWKGRITGTADWWTLDTGDSRKSPLRKVDSISRKLLGYITKNVPGLNDLSVDWITGYVVLSHTSATEPDIDDIRKFDQILLLREGQAVDRLKTINNNARRQQVFDNRKEILDLLSGLDYRSAQPKEIGDFIDIEPIDSPPYPEIERYRGQHRVGPSRDLTLYDLESRHQRGEKFYLREYEALATLASTGLTPAVDLPFSWSDGRYLVLPTALPDSSSTSYGGLRPPDNIEDIREELERSVAIFEGLHTIHEHGIIHRSLGLGNIYFQEDDTGFKATFTQFWSARGKDLSGGTVSVQLDEIKEAILAENPAVAPELFAGYQYAEVTSDTYVISLLLLSRITGITLDHLRSESSMNIEIPLSAEAWASMGPDLSARLIDFFKATLGTETASDTGSGRMNARDCATMLKETIDAVFGPAEIEAPESNLPEEAEGAHPLVQEDKESKPDEDPVLEQPNESEIDPSSDDWGMDSPEDPGLPSELDPPQGGDTGIPTGTVETSDSDESDKNEDGSDERLMLCYGSIEIIITDLGIAIGRDHDNELVIDDAYVSREHAEAIFENGSSILRDSQSANGTSVNGQKITGPTVLKAGDVILIGSDITIYVKAASTSNDDRPEWKLTALSGPDDGAEFNVSGEITTIGRSPSNDIVLNSKKVSRDHCHLVFKSGQPCIEDPGSTNGTFVNDIRVTAQILEDGDSIQLGDTKLRVSMA